MDLRVAIEAWLLFLVVSVVLLLLYLQFLLYYSGRI